MPNGSNEIPDWLRRLPFKEVRFGPGIVGKTSYAVLALIALWLVIAWKISPDALQSCALIFAGLIVTAVVVWWISSTQKFAERNPAQAVLEGAEFVDYKKFEAQTKGQETIIEGTAIENPQAQPRISRAQDVGDE
ncbi:hypothetical protein [Methylorubrum podarium]|jgi:hypothetical protein|uniref:hypothetical protein n=1 Tax=Methylorubrum podarium TaxID=200476 RepID=UPI001EE3192B|nr:hypothetical protein [Methylorubrum podarium]